MSETKTHTVDLVRAVDDAAVRFDRLCRDIDPVLALHFRNSVNTLLAMATVTGAAAGPEAPIVAEAMRTLVFAADSMPDHNPIVGSVVVDGPTDPQ